MRVIVFALLCHVSLFGDLILHPTETQSILYMVDGLKMLNSFPTTQYSVQTRLQSIRGGSDSKNHNVNRNRNHNRKRDHRVSHLFQSTRRGGYLHAPTTKRFHNKSFVNNFAFPEMMHRFKKNDERTKRSTALLGGRKTEGSSNGSKKTQLYVVSSPMLAIQEDFKTKESFFKDERRNKPQAPVSSFDRSDRKEKYGSTSEKPVVSSLTLRSTARKSRALETTISSIIKSKLREFDIRPLDAAVFVTYICSMICLTTPVVLMPVIAGDSSMLIPSSNLFSSVTSSSFAACVASISILGASVGKIMNGFVCQTFGARRSLITYLSALSAFTMWFSLAPNIEQLTWASTGMEFFSSIMWTACAVILATHYESKPERFTKSIGFLSLSSTAASLFAKVLWTFLLTMMDWRTLAQLAAVIAAGGVVVVNQFIMDSPKQKVKPQVQEFSIQSVGESVKLVGSNPLFWKVGLAHAMSFLVRTSDKVLGSFFQEVTGLPRIVCGGLTSSVTIGFALGAFLNTQKFASIAQPKDKQNHIQGLYSSAVVATVALSSCAFPTLQSMLGSVLPDATFLLPLAIILSSGAMATFVSFQFYTLPARFATSFGKNKAVCLSFLDAMGFFVCAFLWNLSSRIVGENGFFQNAVEMGGDMSILSALGISGSSIGWIVTWGCLATCVAVGGYTMLGVLPAIFNWKDEDLQENEENRKRVLSGWNNEVK